VAEIEAAAVAEAVVALAAIVEAEEALVEVSVTEVDVEEAVASAIVAVVEVAVDAVVTVEAVVHPEVEVAVELAQRVECKSILSNLSRNDANSFAGGLSLSPIVTPVSLSLVARKICLSPRTLHPASLSTARSAFPSPTPRAAMMRLRHRPSTVCGILSDPRSPLVSSVVSTTSTSSPDPRFSTSVLRLAHQSLTSPISLDPKAQSTLLSSRIVPAVI
jgi:hypothetical protein